MISSPLFLDHLDTAIGRFAVVADREGRLRACGWTDRHDRMDRHLQTIGGTTTTPATNPGGLTAALRAYFDGALGAIDGLPLSLEGTAFQLRVWQALLTIPCGETISYAALAKRIGQPSAVRAVGLANGANPAGVVVPCHRVIGSDGSLTGYGGGVDRKRWLLRHEGFTGLQGELGLEAAAMTGPSTR